MTTYQGVPGGPRSPETPGPYCLAICRCSRCPQYPEQQRHADLLREQEYAARVHLEGQRSAAQERRRGQVAA